MWRFRRLPCPFQHPVGLNPRPHDVQGKLELPSVADQEADVDALKQWKRSWLPGSAQRGQRHQVRDAKGVTVQDEVNPKL